MGNGRERLSAPFEPADMRRADVRRADVRRADMRRAHLRRMAFPHHPQPPRRHPGPQSGIPLGNDEMENGKWGMSVSGFLHHLRCSAGDGHAVTGDGFKRCRLAPTDFIIIARKLARRHSAA